MEEFAEGQNKMTNANKNEDEGAGGTTVFGLTGELALQGGISKKAQ